MYTVGLSRIWVVYDLVHLSCFSVGAQLLSMCSVVPRSESSLSLIYFRALHLLDSHYASYLNAIMVTHTCENSLSMTFYRSYQHGGNKSQPSSFSSHVSQLRFTPFCSIAYDVALNDDSWPSDLFDISGNTTTSWDTLPV